MSYRKSVFLLGANLNTLDPIGFDNLQILRLQRIMLTLRYKTCIYVWIFVYVDKNFKIPARFYSSE